MGADAFHSDDPSDESSSVRVRERSAAGEPGLAVHALVSAIILPAGILDAETRKILGANEALAALLNRPIEALSVTSALDLIDPMDLVK